MVGVSKKRRRGKSTFKSLERRATTCIASNKLPPNSKKLSCTPTCLTLRTSRQMVASTSSVGVRGATYESSSSGEGAGNASRLIFSLAANGNESKTTIWEDGFVGIICLG